MPCASDGGHVCDGAGSCVECLTTSDCADPEKPFCQAHACVWCGGMLGFPGVPLFPAVGHPVSILALDLNGDGKHDLVMADSANDVVTVVRGRGKGVFDAWIDYPTGSSPVSVAAADLDGDGSPDLAVANYESGTMSVLLGQGDGTFAPKVDYPTTAGADPKTNAVVAADLNGDGRPDLAVTGRGNDTVSVLLNHGDGTFAPRVDYPVGVYPGPVVAADLNGDGRPDLVVGNYQTDSVSVLLGHGDGTFAPRVDYPMGKSDRFLSLAVADLNGDGRPDIAINVQSSVNVLLGRGDGSFGPHLNYGAGVGLRSIAVADMNGDGRPDLAVGSHTSFSSGTVSVMLNTCLP